MKRYYRKNRPSVALFLVSNLLAAGSSVFMSFLLGTFADFVGRVAGAESSAHDLTKPHQFPDDPVGHFNGADEYQHIEYHTSSPM